MNKFRVLLAKELRELVTPLIIVPLLITVALFAGVGQLAKQQGKANQKPQPITILDNDHSTLSAQIAAALTAANFSPTTTSNVSLDKALSSAEANRSVALVIIPSGFAEGIAASQRQSLDLYTIINSFSLKSVQQDAVVKAAIQAVNNTVSERIIASHTSLDPSIVKQPIQLNEHVAIGNQKADTSFAEVLGYVQSQSYIVPIISLIIIIFASQMIASSIATEKENKTLETLLSAPVSRQAIVTAKLLAAGLLGLIFGAVYLFSMRYYLNGLTDLAGQTGPTASSAILANLGLHFGFYQYTLLGLSLFFAILCALAIALILGSFAEDVKSIQSVITPLMILVAIPYILSLLFDLNSLSLPVRALIYAIPFAHPFFAIQFLAFHQYPPIIYGIIYEVIVFSIFVFIASRIFSSDYIVTMKLNFSKKKR